MYCATLKIPRRQYPYRDDEREMYLVNDEDHIRVACEGPRPYFLSVAMRLPRCLLEEQRYGFDMARRIVRVALLHVQIRAVDNCG